MARSHRWQCTASENAKEADFTSCPRRKDHKCYGDRRACFKIHGLDCSDTRTLTQKYVSLCVHTTYKRGAGMHPAPTRALMSNLDAGRTVSELCPSFISGSLGTVTLLFICDTETGQTRAPRCADVHRTCSSNLPSDLYYEQRSICVVRCAAPLLETAAWMA